MKERMKMKIIRKVRRAGSRFFIFLFALMVYAICNPAIGNAQEKTDTGINSVSEVDPSAVVKNLRVIYVPEDTRITRTAVEEIRYVLESKESGGPRIIHEDKLVKGTLFVATLGGTSLNRELIQAGRTNLHNIPADVDAYEIFKYKGALVLLGANERGLLNAVYELQEYVAAEKKLPDEFYVSRLFNPAYRIFHGCFEGWPAKRPDIRYIAHIGATHCLVTHDWQGNNRRLQGYVQVEPFGEAVNSKQVKKNRIQLRKLIEDCKDYGLETALWITELPCQGGPWIPDKRREDFLTRYSPEVLSDCGTYQGKVLCFGHPIVQQYYADVIKQFFSDFPEISILFVMGIDAEGEFCDPKTCPRCKGMSKIEQRDRFLKFLIEEGTKARPGLHVLTTNWGWEGRVWNKFRESQKELPGAGGVFMSAEGDGWQVERQINSFMTEIRNICKTKGQLFIGYDNLHWGDDSVHGVKDIQDFPLGIAAKIKRWMVLEADGVFDHWGTWPEDISTNSIACRKFFLDPYAEAIGVVNEIAVRQFGRSAGPAVLESWKALERGQRILSNACTWTPAQWPQWYRGRTTIPTPEGFAKKRLGGGLFEKQANSFIYNEGTVQDRLEAVYRVWKDAYPFYEQAIAAMDEALAKVDQESLFYSYWWKGSEAIPSPREHLERQKLYLEVTSKVYREIGIHFGLQALYESVAEEPDKYYGIARERLNEDMQACRAAAEVFEKIVSAKQCRTKHSCEQFKKYIQEYRAKAKAIDNYIQQSK